MPSDNVTRPPNFLPTILPFRQLASSPLSTSHLGEDASHEAQADITGPPAKGKQRRIIRQAFTRVAGDLVGVDHLDMPGWKTIKVEYRRHETLVHAVLTTELTHCLNEYCRSKNIKANGLTRKQYLAHTPLDERPRRIAYRAQCYFCKDCKQTSRQPVPGLYKGLRMTRRLRRYIVRQGILPEESFNGIAERVGRSARNIRDIFEKHRAHLVKIREIQTPRVMGMDGVYVKGQESLIVTDLERRRPVMMRPFIRERPVAAALSKMPNLDQVDEVVADMAGSLDRVQKKILPKAIRTKDRYHVQRMANAAVDVVRRALTPGRRERKKGQMSMCPSHILRKRKMQLKAADLSALEWVLALYPVLRLTYELKEAYCEIWSSIDETMARRRYAEWLELHKAWRKEMPKDLRTTFNPLLRVMKNWEEGIFNYFRNRHTNAYTESANAQVKKLVNKAPRLKFDNVNTKIVHGSRLKQQRKANRERGKVPRQQAQPAQPISSPPMASAGVVTEPPQANEPLTPLSTSGSIAADAKQQGPRLDADRIASLKRRPGGTGDSSSPSSPQMLLFE